MTKPITNQTLTLEEIDHIAELARLALSQEEKLLYRQQLSAILEYAAELQTLDIPEGSITSSSLNRSSILRKDESRPGLSQQELLKNAPQVENNQFRVPPILE